MQNFLISGSFIIIFLFFLLFATNKLKTSFLLCIKTSKGNEDIPRQNDFFISFIVSFCILLQNYVTYF